MQMAQWLDLPPPVHDLILLYVDDDDWKSYDLMLVNTNWWKSCYGITRYQVGTIVLKPVGIPYLVYNRLEGKTFATIMRLIFHPNEYNVPPDQYKYVEKPINIQSFRPILRQRPRVVLQQFWNNRFQGQPVCYR